MKECLWTKAGPCKGLPTWQGIYTDYTRNITEPVQYCHYHKQKMAQFKVVSDWAPYIDPDLLTEEDFYREMWS